MNNFSQIARDCEEFAAISTTLLTIDIIGACVLVKGVTLTLAATSTLGVIAGIAMAAFSTATLARSLRRSYELCCLVTGDRVDLRRPGTVLHLRNIFIAEAVLGNAIMTSIRRIFMINFPQLIKNCKEFPKLAATLFTLNAVSACVLVKGIALTLAATSTLSVVAGVIITVLSTATLARSLCHSDTFCYMSIELSNYLKESEYNVKRSCKTVFIDTFINNELALLSRQIYYGSEQS